MDLLKNEILRRAIPDIFTHEDGTPVTKETWEKRRAEMREILSREEYGYAPEAPKEVRVSLREPTQTQMCAGKVTGEFWNVSFDTPKGEFSFPVNFLRPNFPIRQPEWYGNQKQPPVILLLNFRPDIFDKYCPVEEITDAGFAVVQVFYKDVTSDDNNMENGLAGFYPRTRTDGADWGKIRMWAWAASRVMDVLETRTDIDAKHVAVIGHSRLGKTALVASAYDERFACAISNDSGCSGAAITRDKTGERVKNISTTFPFWFCENYKKYQEKEAEMPFDQHYLAALTAPRLLCIGSAWEDKWADPDSEFMCAVLTSRVYDLLSGKEVPALDAVRDDAGRVLDRLECAGELYTFADRHVQYHCRPGTHYLSREDWNIYLALLRNRSGW